MPLKSKEKFSTVHFGNWTWTSADSTRKNQLKIRVFSVHPRPKMVLYGSKRKNKCHPFQILILSHHVDFSSSFSTSPPPPGGQTMRSLSLKKNCPHSADFKLARTRQRRTGRKMGRQEKRCAAGITAHVDTLGAMVKEIKSNGRLRSRASAGSFECCRNREVCRVVAFEQSKAARLATIDRRGLGACLWRESQRDETQRGSHGNPSRCTHILRKRTRELGINIGDFVAFDPRVEVTNGFVRSRFLDDKACVAVLAAAIKSLAESRPKSGAGCHFPDQQL